MEEFNTLEKIRDLFKKNNCEGNDNCYIIAYKNVSQSPAAVFGGAVGGMVGAMEQPWDALLINETENGLGIIYLENTKIFTLKVKPDNLKLKDNSFIFIPNEEIKSIKVKNYGLLNKSVKNITIKTNKETFHLISNVKEKDIEYQNDNIIKFAEKHK